MERILARNSDNISKLISLMTAHEYNVRNHYRNRNTNIQFIFDRLDFDLSNNIFPQSLLEEFFQQVFQPNGSISIQNSILNGLGITNIIVQSMKPKFTNGSYNIGLTLDCYEDVAGSSLLLN